MSEDVSLSAIWQRLSKADKILLATFFASLAFSVSSMYYDFNYGSFGAFAVVLVCWKLFGRLDP